MEERAISDRWVVSVAVSPFGDRIAKACSLAREVSRLTIPEFAERLSAVLKREITPQGVLMVEQGSVMPALDYGIACALVAQILLSVLFGELDIDETALSRLEAMIGG